MDDDLDRALECPDSECYVNIKVWVRSLLRAGLADQQGGAAPGVALLRETPLTKAPPIRSWSPYKFEDGSCGSSYWGDTGKLPEDLFGCSVEIPTATGKTWTSTVVEVLERRADVALVRDTGRPPDAA